MTLDATPRCARCNTVMVGTSGWIPVCPKCRAEAESAFQSQASRETDALRAQRHHEVFMMVLTKAIDASGKFVDADKCVLIARTVADAAYPPTEKS